VSIPQFEGVIGHFRSRDLFTDDLFTEVSPPFPLSDADAARRRDAKSRLGVLRSGYSDERKSHPGPPVPPNDPPAR
ncbi:MAG: hypothetical protein ACLPXW_22900, partial [Xanthobacteraceae bacterium]